MASEDFAALDKLFAKHAGLGGELKLLNTVFAYLRDKRNFFNSPGAAQSVSNLAKKFADEAAAAKKKEAETKAAAPAAPVAPPAEEKQISVPQPTKKMTIEEIVDEPTPAPAPSSSSAENSSTSSPSSSSSDAPAKPEEKKDSEDERPKNPGCGGETDKYVWTQTLTELNVRIKVPAGLKAKDFQISIRPKTLLVKLKNGETFVDGALHDEIITDDSTWTLEQDRFTPYPFISLYLRKLDQFKWWKCVVQGDPEIDTTKINPEPGKLNDLDGETRGIVEKMMFDQRARQMGTKTSDELRKDEILKKFMAKHPEMDFSNAKMM